MKARAPWNVRATFTPASEGEIRALRERYLDGLIAGQEAFLEALIPSAEHYLIDVRGEVAGYCVVHAGDVLIEYFVDDAFLPYSHTVLIQLVAEKNIASALIKSFDHAFMACAMDLQIAVRSRGVLVRDYVPRDLPRVPSIRYEQRAAMEGDLPRVRAVDQQVFSDPARLLHVVRAGWMRLFEREAVLIGFGIIRPVIAGRKEVDIGIAVDRPFRNKGYALYMLRDMLDYCVASGLKPVAGCAKENEPSIRMGLRVGLVSRYRLLELRFR